MVGEPSGLAVSDDAASGAIFPDASASRSVAAGGVHWHVQVLGSGPVLLLLHGTGASSHSWRDVVPLLAPRHTLVVPDLPGHGRSGALAGAATLPAVAAAVGALLAALQLQPVHAVGHSAGAAISAWMALQPATPVRRLVWLNPALLPFDGWAGVVFAPLARLLAGSGVVARLAAWRAGDAAAVRRMIAGTGSTLSADGIARYQQLVRNPSHVAGALALMANWDLEPLAAALPRLQQPVLVVAGDGDRAVPVRQVLQAAAALPSARVQRLPGGHLLHEERPADVARLVADWLQDN